MVESFKEIKKGSIFFSVCFFLLLLQSALVQGQTIIEVTQNPGPGQFGTLKGAYQEIENNGDAGTVTYHVIIKDDVPVAPTDEELFWDNASGSPEHPIKIFSEENRETIDLGTGDNGYNLHFNNVSYIEIYNITFENCLPGILLSNFDHSIIKYCKFSSSYIEDGTGGGCIWIGKNKNWSERRWHNGDEDQRSNHTKIKYNLFEEFEIGNPCVEQKYQAIYISRGNFNNSFYGNTIIDPSGSGIKFGHAYQESNSVRRNFIYQKYIMHHQGVVEDCDYERLCNLYDNGNNSRWNIKIGAEDDDPLSTIFDNNISNNYLYSEQKVPHCDGYGHSLSGTLTLVLEDKSLINTNTIENNSNYYENERTPFDPHWLGYLPDRITNKVVVGDFNRDGKKNEIAAFYEGGGETSIHVFEAEGRFFHYSGSNGWWQSSGYKAKRIEGRIVSGDFDNDGYHDDISVFYDYGNGNNGNETRIHVFRSTGHSFTYSGSGGAWQSTGYNANDITGRVVSGDFDNDGYHDDISVFYDYGNGNSGSETRIHVFRSQGGYFTYSGSGGAWQSTGYNANDITGRVVSGDFDNDGYHDDISAFYDYGNGNSGGETRIHVFRSQGGYFTYSGSGGAWQSTGYNANEITGRVVSGDFNSDGDVDHLVSFYDYTFHSGYTRTHTWKYKYGAFKYLNRSLGFPWLVSNADNYKMAKNVGKNSKEKENKEIDKNKTKLVGNSEIMVYPNPTQEFFMVDYDAKKLPFSNKGLIVVVRDVSGKVIMKKNSQDLDGRLQLSVNGISSGMYFLELKQNQKRVHKAPIKIFKQ